jgi:hypothetical protein
VSYPNRHLRNIRTRETAAQWRRNEEGTEPMNTIRQFVKSHHIGFKADIARAEAER